jgi:hypothetical protein
LQRSQVAVVSFDVHVERPQSLHAVSALPVIIYSNDDVSDKVGVVTTLLNQVAETAT